MIDGEKLESMAREILAAKADATTIFLFREEYRHRTAPPNIIEATRIKERPKLPAVVVQAARKLDIEKGTE